MSRKICVATGTRAEYGLLYWLMREIQDDSDLTLQILVTGMHLSPEFGSTYKIIEDDGFTISAKVEMLLSSDTPVSVAKSIGVGIMGFADALERLKPDILVVLGDRTEMLAIAQTALILRIPLAHIHGGETTQGAIDEAIRHSITKMSHLHFVAAKEYEKRVIQLGENPEKVFNFGAIGVDNIAKLKLLEREELEESINFKLGNLNFLVTYHPVTLMENNSAQAFDELLIALDNFFSAKIIFTKPNSDPENNIINYKIAQYVSYNKTRAITFNSLGQLRYLSAIKNCDLVIGNSSSGLIEVPFLKKPTINIGDRQKGRLKATSIIDCAEKSKDIIISINKALSFEFQLSLKNVVSPYGQGDVSIKIKNVLKNIQLNNIQLNNIIIKKFYDL
ncbi:UDP-N-acetylglucosamine 2-epimerase [Cyanobacterium sp. Dongsha4]|uniref:UDP-N-acetylglucosamine 2-epimerase n=1 Tax=Cyanobacterium sp. DS4 TaxID=2878255 RepID=UPI002E80045C|nr:UDP-N-acetylglucosamine 2-epimerase [Cyanobacterium sp. Dongsha4]WVL02266.1 UDP-N-acetylglucosamine 2-epimerase [Cyanobacterium sp. Dongsha4]